MKKKSLLKELKSSSFLNLWGKTNLSKLINIIKKVDLVIGYDSSPIHMAINVGPIQYVF